MSYTTIKLRQLVLGLNPYILIEVKNGKIDLTMQGMNKRETLAVLRSALSSIKRTKQAAFVALAESEEDDLDVVDTDEFFGDDDD